MGDGAPSIPDLFELPHNNSFTLHPGPQGGYHLFVQVRATNIDPTNVVCTRRLIDPASGLVLREQGEELGMVAVAEGVYSFPHALLTFICPSIISNWRMNNYSFDLEVMLKDDLGTVLRSRIPVVPICPKGDEDLTCLFDSERGCAPWSW